MPMYDVRLDGHHAQYYSVIVEVEADSEEEAKAKARVMEDRGQIDWGEPKSMSSDMIVDDVDAEEID